MRIWLITVGEPLPTDGEHVRLMRTGILAEYLSSEGHEVVWWTSTFNHTAKCHRVCEDTTLTAASGVKLRLLHSIGYPRNVSLRRIVNHRGVARRFREQAKSEDPPNVILCSFPTIELSRAATRYGAERSIPVVLDVRDLWPDIFTEVVPKRLKRLTALLVAGMAWDARASLRQATCITAVSSEYLDWGLRCAGRDKTANDLVFPLAGAKPEVTPEQLQLAESQLRSKGVDPTKTIFWFVGVFGHTYDLATVIEVARELNSGSNGNVQFVLCGGGDFEEEWMSCASGLENVVFPGWIGAPEFAYMSEVSSVGLAAYSVGAPQSLPNKVLEYLSAGLPVVTSLKGETEALLLRHDCGIKYEPGNKHSLLQAVSRLLRDAEVRTRMGRNARILYQQNFTPETVYSEMRDHLLRVARSGRAATDVE